jgi:hypothetical protein
MSKMSILNNENGFSVHIYITNTAVLIELSNLAKYIYVIYRLRGPDEKNCAEATVFLIRTDAAGK